MATPIDLTGAVFDKPDLTGATFDPPAPPRGAISEIGTGVKRGALVGLPTMVGRGLQYLSEPGNTIYEAGRGMVSSAEARGQQPGLALHPDEHNVVTNALASGGEMLAPSLAVPAAVGLGAAALGAGPLTATALAALGGGALFGAQAGQETLEKGKAAGLDDHTAREAARINAATTMAAQAGMGMIGGQMLGTVGRTLMPMFKSEGASLAASTLSELAGTSGILKPAVKATAAGMVEGTALNAGQAAVSSAIENQYGIGDTTPGQAAADSIAPTLGLTALMGPLALVTRALNVRAAKTRTESLAHPDTPVPIRTQLADAYAERLAEADPASAAAFRTNAQNAIDFKAALPVDSMLFSPDAVPRRNAITEGLPTTPQLENNPSPLVVFPDGTIGNTAQQVEQYLRGLPEDQQIAARAKLFGQGEQVVPPEQPNALAPDSTPRLPFTPDAGRMFAFPDGTITRDPAAVESFVNGLPENQQVAARARLLGLGAVDATPAEPAARAPNDPKPRADIETDWKAAMAANDMDAKQQSLVPFMKRVESMGVDKMATHAEQITALEGLAADKKVSQGVRDRASMLVEQWKKDMPTEEKIEPPIDDNSPRTFDGAYFLSQVMGEKQVPAADDALLAATLGKLGMGENTPAVAETTKPAIAGEPAAAPGENIPASAEPAKPAIAGKPAAAPGDNIPLTGRDMPVTDLAEAVSDKVMDLRLGFTQRLRAGEKLSPLEKERYEDLNNFAQALQPYTEGRAKPQDEGWVKAMAEMVDKAGEPYKKTLRQELIPGPKMSDPMATDMAILAPAALSGKVSDVLRNFEKNGSQQWVRDVAAKLLPLLPDTTIGAGKNTHPRDASFGYDPKDGTAFAGEYFTENNHIDIYPRGAREHTILHEATHAATSFQVERAKKIGVPKNEEEARLKNAYGELEKIRLAAQMYSRETTGSVDTHYGLESPHEFLAELNSNPEFQQFLQQQKTGPVTLWERVKVAIGKMLGRDWNLTQLDRALRISDEFMSPRQLNETFDASPDGAARAGDVALRQTLDAADRKAYSIDPSKIGLPVMKAFLPLQNFTYIAGRVRANPELVASGLSAGVDAHVAADASNRILTTRLNDIGSKYVSAVGRMQRGMDDIKSRAVDREMATIGGEASRVGFDFRKNGRDNLAMDASIDPADKDYIDKIHRQWTQLQAQHPDAAALLEEGERLNRRTLIEKVATVAANMMDDRAGRARHLEAELMRMAPTDAARAEKENQVRLATTESLMASAHSKGLDLMDKTLADGKNPDPARFHDTATANLGARLQAAFTAARQLPDGSPLRTTMQALESLYAKEAKHPYFSLGRDGDFFMKVDFKNIDAATNARIQDALKNTNKVVGDLTRGDANAFFRFGSFDEAKALGERLVAIDSNRIINSAWGRLAEKTHEAANVSPALRTLLSSVDDMRMEGISGPQADLVKQTLTRQLLSMLPETAARSASMGRRGVPGYDDNFLTQFSQRAQGAVHDTANVYTSRAYTAAAQQRAQAIDQLNRTGSDDARQRAQLINDEINKRYANAMQPVPADWVTAANSVSHSFYLGMSPAYFIRAMVQPWVRGVPFVGSKFGHFAAMQELVAAQAAGLKMVANSVRAATTKDGLRGLLNTPVELQNLGLSDREQAWVNEAHANGKLDLGASSQLLRMALEPGGNRKLQDAMRYAATTTQYAEMANRFGIGLAALRLATKRPELLGAHMTPEAYANYAMEIAMDDFSPSNTARALGRHGFAGKATPLFTQFQQYNMQTIQQIARTVHDGFFGLDKSPEGIQRGQEARREFGGLMATTGVVAGALGLPFASAFAGIYNSVMNDPNDPKDVRVTMRNWAANTFGPQMGAVLMKGLPAALNLDTTSLGNQGILPGSDFLADRTLWKERSESQVRNALGPAVSLGLDMTTAVSKMMDGYWVKGIEAALPVGIRTYFKTAEMLAGNGQYTDSRNNPTPLKVGASDIAWRALGFQTESKATQGDAQRDFIINQQRIKNRRELIADEFVKGSRDPSAIPSAVADLVAFNAKQPTQPITSHEISGAVSGYHTRFALGEASGMGVAVSRKQYPALTNTERFAAMPSR